jgi:hypothetical protein
MSAWRSTFRIAAVIAVAAVCVSLVALVKWASSIECNMGPGINDFVAPLAGGYDLGIRQATTLQSTCAMTQKTRLS